MLGPNVNMAVGPTFLKLGSRPEDLVQGTRCRTRTGSSCAMSTRNPLHFLCFANKNRAIDALGADPLNGYRDSNVATFQSIEVIRYRVGALRRNIGAALPPMTGVVFPILIRSCR